MEKFESNPINPEERSRRKEELTRLKTGKYLPWDLGEAIIQYGEASGDEVTYFERLNFEDTLAEISRLKNEKKDDFASDPEIRQLEIDVLTRIWNEFAARADEEIKDTNTE